MATNASTVKPSGKKGFGFGVILVCLLMALGAVALLPSTIIISLGMIPTAVAYFVDNSRERGLGRVVMCLNAAGVLPGLLRLWHQGHTVSNALEIACEPIMMALVLVPSAVGWMIYGYVPLLVVGLVRKKAEAQIRALEKAQENLIQQWGPAVAGMSRKEDVIIGEAGSDKIAEDLSA